MESHGGRRARPGALVAAGRTSDVYQFGASTVVKVPRPDVPAHWARLEAQYTAAIASLDVPAPTVVDVTEVDGRSAIVFERIHGTPMWSLMLAEPWRIEELAGVLAACHRRILSAGPPDEMVALADRMVGKIDEVDQVSEQDRADARELVRSLPRGAALLHGDLHPGNVLMTADGPVAIDWFDASVGHPVADVVRSSLLMRSFGDRGAPPHLPGSTVDMLRVLHGAYVEAMSDVLAVQSDELRRWEAVVALSRLSEGAQPDEPALVALWTARDEATGPLFEALRASSVSRSCP